MLFKTHNKVCLNRFYDIYDTIFKSVPGGFPARSFYLKSLSGKGFSFGHLAGFLGVVYIFVSFVFLIQSPVGGSAEKTVSYYDLKDDIVQRNEALLGLEGRQVLRLFDFPELVRLDVPVSLWQYRSDDCVLDLFLGVDDPKLSVERVIHSETRPRDPGNDYVGWGECVSAFLSPEGASEFALLSDN